METQWYLRKTIHGSEVFAVLKAEFEAKQLLSERSWNLRREENMEWQATTAVSDWFFIGEDTVWESTENEAFSYLPQIAIQTKDSPIRSNSLIIDIESNPYDKSNFPSYLHRLTRVLTFYIEHKISPWTLDKFLTTKEKGVYIQGLAEDDGRLYLEITGNQYLEKPISKEAIQVLINNGWNLADDGGRHPNHWFETTLESETAQSISERLVRTLFFAYGIGPLDSMTITPHPLDAGISYQEFNSYF